MARITVLICSNPRCAPEDQAQQLTLAAQQTMQLHQLTGEVFTVRCLELCGHGPHVVIHGAAGDVADLHRAPDGGVAYDGVDPALMRQLLTEHAAYGKPLTVALHQPGQPRR